jgi:hypothetical protein
MTMRTHTHLKCPCGHVGTITVSENDQPHSAEWSSATYEGLEHNGTYAGPDNWFSEMRFSCPKCGASLTPEHIVKG